MREEQQGAINLGDEVEDTITGFTGVVIGVTKWLHGCRRLAVQPRELREGKPVDPVSFDEPQLRLVRPEVAAGTSDRGGPRPEPQRRPDAR